MSHDHETPVQRILSGMFGDRVSSNILDKRVLIGNTGTYVEPDAVVISDDLVIEIEARTAKQIRGAILDLLLSPWKKKLLIVRPTTDDVASKKEHFLVALRARLRSDEQGAVVILNKEPDAQRDHEAILEGLEILDIKP